MVASRFGAGSTQPDALVLAAGGQARAVARKVTEQGYTIVLSLGDQESDLKGGYAERTFKLPNTVYYLP